MRCCAICRGHRSPHWHRSRFPANGAAPRGGRRLKVEALGLAGWVGCAGGAASTSMYARSPLARARSPARTARPGLGVLPNPPEACLGPMRLTPLRSPPTRPRTVSVCVHHGKEREDQKRKRIASLCIHAWRGSTVSTKVDTYQQPRETVGGGAVWGCRTVGAMGPRHASGGLGRRPNPGLAVCAGQRTRARCHRAPKDGFTACPAAPHRPAQPSPIQSCCCCCCCRCRCFCRCRAASPARTPTSPSLQSPAGRGSPATAAASATPGSSHHAGPATAATPATAPPRCNRAHPRAARR